MNFQIKPKDIQQFLFKLGYMWDGILVICCSDNHAMTEKDLEDPSAIHSINAYKNNNIEILNFIVSGEKFQFMIDDLDWNNRTEFYFGEDMSNKWKKFLLRKYKNKYALFLQEKINIRRKNIISEYDKSKEKIELMLDKLNKETEEKLNNCKMLEQSLSKYIEHNIVK